MFDGATRLPYAMEERPGSRHLLVAFSGLRPGERQEEPPPDTGPFLPDAAAHRLKVGVEPGLFIGPNRSLAGVHTAVALVQREQERLGIPPERTITLGTSMAGLTALSIGLRTGAGRVIAGAPPVRMASDLKAFGRGDDTMQAAKLLYRRLLLLAEDAGQEPAVEYLDQAIFHVARRATHEATLHFMVSEQDSTTRSVQAFVAELEQHPTLRAELKFVNYGNHLHVGRYFRQYALEVATEAGLVVQPVA